MNTILKFQKLGLSEQLADLLKTKYQIDINEIYKFDLETAQMMNVESDIIQDNSGEEEEDVDEK